MKNLAVFSMIIALFVVSANSAFSQCTTDPVNAISVLSPNWNSQGETCPNEVLELYAVDYNNPSGTTYDWNIMGATIISGQGTNTVFVRTSSNVNTYLDFGVRAKDGNCSYSSWVYIDGITVSCGGGGGL